MTAANRFGPWLNKPDPFVVELNKPFTRDQYRHLSTSNLYAAISDTERTVLTADTDDERDEAEFALQELRAVLQERR